MGSLYWQLNDVWPVASWATVDFYNMYKAAHYKIRNSYNKIYPVITYANETNSYLLKILTDDIQYV